MPMGSAPDVESGISMVEVILCTCLIMSCK